MRLNQMQRARPADEERREDWRQRGAAPATEQTPEKRPRACLPAARGSSKRHRGSFFDTSARGAFCAQTR